MVKRFPQTIPNLAEQSASLYAFTQETTIFVKDGAQFETEFNVYCNKVTFLADSLITLGAVMNNETAIAKYQLILHHFKNEFPKIEKEENDFLQRRRAFEERYKAIDAAVKKFKMLTS